MKRSFFQTALVSILLYGCTTWMQAKRLEKKQDGNYTRMLRAILNKSWRQHPTNTKYTATFPPSRKLSKLDEPDMQDTAEEPWRAHKWCTPRDPHIWPGKSKTISSNIHTAAMWGYGMQPWRPAGGDERLGEVAKEGQGYPCLRHDMMMMMMIQKNQTHSTLLPGGGWSVPYMSALEVVLLWYSSSDW